MTDYSTKGHYYIEEPRPEVVRLIGLLNAKSTVLDVGAGYGNNTKALLAAGHSVHALETNEQAAQSLKHLATVYPGRLTVSSESVESYRPAQSFDAVVCCMVLHFMESAEDAARSIAAMQDATKPGGYNVVLSYLQTDKLTDDYTYLLKPNQLREMYSQWETIEYREGYVTAWSKARSLKAVLRILAGRRGYKAARMITCKLK